MSSEPLSLWQVLKEEYESFHGPLPAVYLRLNSPADVARELNDAGNSLSTYLVGHLSKQTQTALAAHKASAPLSQSLQSDLLDALNARLRDAELYLHYPTAARPDKPDVQTILTRANVQKTVAQLAAQPLQGDELMSVNRLLLEAVYPGLKATVPADVKEMYALIRAENHSALCFSGGGIRSATFNLGITQGLARHGLLQNFDYLSSVSGGGYTGGWLSAWIHRQGLEAVVAQLRNPPASPVDPEPKPLVHLRAFSNYLSPRLGLLSADTWTMVATLLRNIILNWMVLVPILIGLLILPRMWLSFLYGTSFNFLALPFKAAFGFPLSLTIGFIANCVALSYIGLNLPSTGRSEFVYDEFQRLNIDSQPVSKLEWMRRAVIGTDGQGRFLRLGLLPLLISSIAFVTYWARNEDRLALSGGKLAGFAAALVVVPLIICFGYRIYTRKGRLSVALIMAVGAAVIIFAAQFISGTLAWLGATKIELFKFPRENIILYSCLALPLLLGLLMLAGTLISGLTSRFTEDDDHEWWSRIGAWMYIASLAWSLYSALVLFGPYLFVWLADWRTSSQYWVARVSTAVGIISGAISLFGGFSAKTPANEQESKKAGAGGIALQAVTSLLGPVFLAFILALLSFVAGWLLALSRFLPGAVKSLLRVATAGPPPRFVPWLPSQAINHLAILLHSPLRLLAVLFVLLVALGLLMGRAISTNKFSLHYFWRNRIIRAYLGASHEPRKPNPFTGFDTEDNIYMHELRPHQPGSRVEGKPQPQEKKLLHVINIALNLTASQRLAWQERQAESFTVSPLHAGNYLLGYRKAMDYGRRPRNGKWGISLGTSVAISGAFASPNMGYMMTSPVVRFLMTLFNVRFGWWLGNPGKAGDAGVPFGRTFDRDSPRLSVTPIFQEALGLTDDQAGYVYLSDGGHFENLGLYEMVLRRCRLIVIGDGSSDEKYTFQALGLAIRQIRIDLGVPIEFKSFHIKGRSLDLKGAYCAVGKIRYSCVDGGSREADGDLILLKPALRGDEPRDVLNYASEHDAFPQEFIGDQWFSESQFESYRALGSHIVDEACRAGDEVQDNNTFADLQAFGENLVENLEKISLTDFEQKLLENLGGIPKGIGEVLDYLKTPKPTNGTKQPTS
ncbi:MAG: hypothetical protein QOF02_2738 [Blastocatellia bacterium]|jgi:hypothetical protein|nr:hypothetical protein [Blastocatellia bacterium]